MSRPDGTWAGSVWTSAWLVAALVVGLVGLGAPAEGGVDEATTRQQPAWLQRVNELRTGSGLHELTEDPDRSAAILEAVTYMAEQGRTSHQLPDEAGPRAQEAAASSNLSQDNLGTSDVAVVDRWMTDPGHLVNVLNPDVLFTGFARADGPDSTFSGLWTIQRTDDPATTTSYPYLFPGDGVTVTLPPYDGLALPDPLDHCPGYTAPTGWPAMALLGSSFDELVEVGGSALVDTATGEAVPHCLLVLQDDPILRNTASLIPRTPLAEGTYRATVVADGVEQTWTFGVGATPSHDPFGPGDPDEPAPVAPVASELTAEDPSALSVRISGERFADDDADHVVLASAERFPDALAGTALSGVGPMLLTRSAGLTEAVAREIERVLPSGGTVYLLGGEAALSPAVEDAVVALGHQPLRLQGPTRVHTAVEVARTVVALYGSQDPVVARAGAAGGDETAAWADSVAIGAWTAASRNPVLLTDSTSLSPQVDAVLRELGIGLTTIVGGTAAVSEAVEQALPGPRRVAGASRTGTAVAIDAELVLGGGVVLVDGFAVDGWASGLAGAGLAADRGWSVLLAADGFLPADTAGALPPCASQVVVVGDTAFASGLRGPLAEVLDPGC